MVKDWKPVFLIELQADILSVGTRSHCQLWVTFVVFNAIFGEVVCKCYFFYHSMWFSSSRMQRMIEGRRHRFNFWCNLIFRCRFVSNCSSFYTSLCFARYISDMKQYFECYYQKNKRQDVLDNSSVPPALGGWWSRQIGRKKMTAVAAAVYRHRTLPLFTVWSFFTCSSFRILLLQFY